MTAQHIDTPLTAAETVAVLADASTWPRCGDCGGLKPGQGSGTLVGRLRDMGAFSQTELDLVGRALEAVAT